MMKTLTAVFVTLGLMAGAARAQEYQYSSTTFDGPPTAQALNYWSAKGLELATLVPFVDTTNSTSYIAYFKRPASLPNDAFIKMGVIMRCLSDRALSEVDQKGVEADLDSVSEECRALAAESGATKAFFFTAPGNGGEVFVARQNVTCMINDGMQSNAPNEFTLLAGARMTCKPYTAQADNQLKAQWEQTHPDVSWNCFYDGANGQRRVQTFAARPYPAPEPEGWTFLGCKPFGPGSFAESALKGEREEHAAIYGYRCNIGGGRFEYFSSLDDMNRNHPDAECVALTDSPAVGVKRTQSDRGALLMEHAKCVTAYARDHRPAKNLDAFYEGATDACKHLR